jgi:hypothetical protein
MRKEFQTARDVVLGSETLPQEEDNIDIFIGKPFWICDQIKHNKEYTEAYGSCCFNHMIGIPLKNGIVHPIYDYEKEIQDAIPGIINRSMKSTFPFVIFGSLIPNLFMSNESLSKFFCSTI